MKYEFLDHTADTKIRAYGSDIEEAFVNAGLAVFSVLKDPEDVKSLIEKNINVKSKDYYGLLYEFIEELLFFLDTEGFLLSKIKNLKIVKNKELELSCIVLGDSADNYNISGNIKSITYNDMIIDKNFKEGEKKVMLQFVLDL